MSERMKAALAEFKRVAEATAYPMIGVTIQRDSDTEYTVDGVFDLEKALAAAIAAAGAPETEPTPEMIAVGAEVILENYDQVSSETLAAWVFRAMSSAKASLCQDLVERPDKP